MPTRPSPFPVLVALSALALLGGCGASESSPDARPSSGADTGATLDGGGPLDAGTMDSGVADAGKEDAGPEDSGTEDAGTEDTGTTWPDSGAPDPDTGVVDTGPATIEVDPSQTFQTMAGFEAVAELGEFECDPTAYANYRSTVLDRAVDELGISRVRLELSSGSENSIDHFARLQAGEVDLATWRASLRYRVENDNPNPRVINSSMFHFSELDHQVREIVAPLRQRLAARGEQLHVNLAYVDYSPTQNPHEEDPEEHGELVKEAFRHLFIYHGWVPDTMEVVIDPDLFEWSPNEVTQALAATGLRLAESGYTPRFAAPSTYDMAVSVNYFDNIAANADALSYLAELSYHRYSGASAGAVNAIQQRVRRYNLSGAMLEHRGATWDQLHRGLLDTDISSWTQFALASCGPDDGSSYFVVDASNPSNPTVSRGSQSRYLPQYFKYIRQGAVRHGTVVRDSSLSPIAFENAGGRGWTVVVLTQGAVRFTIGGLPAGIYGAAYTTASVEDRALPDQTLRAGQDLSVDMPAAGVVTVFAR